MEWFGKLWLLVRHLLILYLVMFISIAFFLLIADCFWLTGPAFRLKSVSGRGLCAEEGEAAQRKWVVIHGVLGSRPWVSHKSGLCLNWIFRESWFPERPMKAGACVSTSELSWGYLMYVNVCQETGSEKPLEGIKHFPQAVGTSRPEGGRLLSGCWQDFLFHTEHLGP